MPPLYEHQSRFLIKNPDRAILSWEAGIGKTRAACEWIKLRYPEKALVICTKAIKQKWIDDLKKWKVENDVQVVTKEEFKNNYELIPVFPLLVVDECHHFSSPLFIQKQTSKLTSRLFDYVQKKDSMNILLMSANVVRSSPWNIHTLAVLAKMHAPHWRDYQEKFFELIKRPYLRGLAWSSKKDWQKKVQSIINKICNIALMIDCADVPVHEYEVINIPPSENLLREQAEIKKWEYEAMALWTKLHRLESGEDKLKIIKEIGESNKKVIIVCHYREQIDKWAEELAKYKQVFVLHGGVKNQNIIIQEAQEASECYFIIQASMGVGFDADKFSLMIFASMSYKYVDFSQMKGRINRIHNLHRNRYVYLLGGKYDRAVYETVLKGEDFDPVVYMRSNVV